MHFIPQKNWGGGSSSTSRCIMSWREKGLCHNDYTTSEESGLCKLWDSKPELLRRLIEIKQIFGDWCCQSCWSICLVISLLLSFTHELALTWLLCLTHAPLELLILPRLAAEKPVKKDSVFCAVAPISIKCYKYHIHSEVVGHWDLLWFTCEQ